MEVIKAVFVAEKRQYHGLIKIPVSESANYAEKFIDWNTLSLKCLGSLRFFKEIVW